MKCKHCGYEAPERAVICPECGEILPRIPDTEDEKKTSRSTESDSFSMPFLGAAPVEAEEEEQEEIQDPVERKRQQREKKTRLRRRITGIIVLVLVVVICVLYGVFLGGYKLAVFRYIKGMDYSSGSLYTAVIPDAYVDYLETTYDTTRREVKEMVGDYFVSWNKNYGTSGRMHYQIRYASKLNDTDDLRALEEDLKSLYGISVEIQKAVEVRLVIYDSKKKWTEDAVFVKIGGRWCSMTAMDTIDYVCQYDGYNQW